MKLNPFSLLPALAFALVSSVTEAQTDTPETLPATSRPAPTHTGMASRDLNRPSRALNPDLSMTALGLYRKSTLGNDPNYASPNGLSLQETELQLTADVDPYLRAVGILAVSGSDPAGYSIEPEEVYFETIQLPSVSLKAGKFRTALGRHNLLHTHAFPFIDAPLTRSALFGDEGLNDVGVSAAALIPAPWYLELVVQGLAGQADYYNSTSSNDHSGVAQLKSLWDLGASSSIELQIFGTTGKNQWDGTSRAYGADATFKWRPVRGGLYRSLTWTTEYIRGIQRDNPLGEKNGGVSSWIQYQFAQRWWAQIRGEYMGIGRSELVDNGRRQSALLGFFPSEFSGFRLQYDHLEQRNQREDHAVSLQWIVSIGAHPAHLY